MCVERVRVDACRVDVCGQSKACFMLLRQLDGVATPSLLRRRGRFIVLRRVALHRGAFHRQNARGVWGSRISLLVCFGSVRRFRLFISDGERKKERVLLQLELIDVEQQCSSVFQSYMCVYQPESLTKLYCSNKNNHIRMNILLTER